MRIDPEEFDKQIAYVKMLPLALIVEIRIIETLVKCLGMKTSQKK